MPGLRVEQAERANRLALRRPERSTGIEAKPAGFDEWVVRETAVARQVFHDEHLVARNDVAAYGNIARRLAREGEIVGEPCLRFKKDPITVH